MNNTPAVNNTQTIARNSFWFGLELFFNLCAAFLTSVIVARVIGPQRLDQFNYVAWLTTITSALGTVGLPMTTRKYMAECLNRGDAGVARAIYATGLKLQILMAAGVTLAAVSLVAMAESPAHRVVSLLLVANMAPRMIGFIPSQANNAAEMMKGNTAAALTGGVLNTGLTLFSLWIGWGLVGVASGLAAGSAAETILKLRGVRTWMRAIPPAPIPPEMKKRMFSYSGQGLVLMALNVVVWDRSDLVILRALNHHVGQVTFFSIAFNLTERVLMIPNAFGHPLGATMMAQYGRGEERLHQLTVCGAKYAFLLALPLLAGMACISGPAILLLYGHAYQPMIPVLAIAAVLAIPKSLIAPPTLLLQTYECQGYLIGVGCACGALDILLDVLLTPSHGAVGAAVANGAAQTAAAIAVWYRVRRAFRLNLRPARFGRIALSGIVMAAVVVAVEHLEAGYAGLVVAVVSGAAVWFAMLRLTGAIDQQDGQRFVHIGRILPERVRPIYNRFVSMVAAS